MNALEHLRREEHFTENEKQIAHYILKHPEAATRMSSRELARETFTSPTSVLRFCKKLGFQNYNDFKVNIVSELKSIDLASTIVSRNENALLVLGKMATLEAQVIKETMRRASPEALEGIAKHLAKTRYIDIFARDANAEIGRYASHNFFMAGKICTVYKDLDKMMFNAFELPTDHTPFLISKSGTDRAIIETAAQLTERGVPTIAMTADLDSPLARACNFALEGFYYPEYDKFGDIVFASAAKYLFDALLVMTFSKDYDHIMELNGKYDALYYERLDRARQGM